MAVAEQVLSGYVAVVTGGSRGIGRAICKKLGYLGATVVVNYAKSAAQAEEVVSDIVKAGGKASALCFDVGNGEAVEAAFKQIISEQGKVDILVNNAGIASDSLILRMKNDDWQRTLDVNLSSCFYCAKAAAKAMLKSQNGRVVNISSVIGEMGNAGQVAYAASKAGILGFTKSLARELGSRSITVNAIAPGYIKTEMTAVLDDSQREELLRAVPLRKLGTPEDVAELVAFLCSPSAAYITGQVIGINGGMYM